MCVWANDDHFRVSNQGIHESGNNPKGAHQVAWNVADKPKVVETVDWLGLKAPALVDFVLFG